MKLNDWSFVNTDISLKVTPHWTGESYVMEQLIKISFLVNSNSNPNWLIFYLLIATRKYKNTQMTTL